MPESMSENSNMQVRELSKASEASLPYTLIIMMFLVPAGAELHRLKKGTWGLICQLLKEH